MTDATQIESVEALQAQIEALKKQLARSKRKPTIEYLGETIPADLATGGKLSALSVKSRGIGMHGDGGNLWLQVTPGGRSWVFRYRWGSKGREMGLGSVQDVSIGEARGRAVICRRLVRDGIDPIERRRQLAAEDAADVRRITFRKATERYIAAHKPTWKNEKHSAQWSSTMETYAHPVIGDLLVGDVDTDQVLKIVEPIWHTKPETAGRVRGRIETVLDWATARRMRTGENPARWKGHMQKLLPPRSKVRSVRHHPALPYSQAHEFWRALEEKEGVSVEALRFLILTSSRTGEARGARWGEFDLREKFWTCPAERMKGGKEHRVPLCDEAIALLERIRPSGAEPPSKDDFVFPGAKPGKSLSDGALTELIKGMHDERPWVDAAGERITTHGFRSTFRDWAAERTAYPNEMVEIALAHAIDDKTEAAYRRGDMLDRRRRLMTDWSKYCTTAPPVRAPNAVNISFARGA